MNYLILLLVGALVFVGIGCAPVKSAPASPNIVINKNVIVGISDCTRESDNTGPSLPCQGLSNIEVNYFTTSNTESDAEIEESFEDLVDSEIKLPIPAPL